MTDTKIKIKNVKSKILMYLRFRITRTYKRLSLIFIKTFESLCKIICIMCSKINTIDMFFFLILDT